MKAISRVIGLLVFVAVNCMTPPVWADHPDDIYWDNNISPSITGVDGTIGATLDFSGTLVVGGEFSIEGNSIANNIAVWDGKSWSPLSSGMNERVNALTVYEGRLIAGGTFTIAGGVRANHIAFWDGSNWSPLDSGLDNEVCALTTFEGKLIAGGRFKYAGEVPAVCIASWDGSSWSPLGVGMAGFHFPSNVAVLSLCVYENELIAGGRFTRAGDLSANYVASWDGSRWLPLGSGMDNEVRSLTVYDGKLIAGGKFSAAGGVPGNRVTSWDGTRWSSLGMGPAQAWQDYVNALTVHDGKLIAGGVFSFAGVEPTQCVAAWDGSSWSALGSGTDGCVAALIRFCGELIVGGGFTVAGNKAATALAGWMKPWSVNIDVLPGQHPNWLPLPPESVDQELIPIAITGAPDLDVRLIDPTTVAVNGLSPYRLGFEIGHGDTTKSGGPLYQYADVSGSECSSLSTFDCISGGSDGLEDLVMYFDPDALLNSLKAVQAAKLTPDSPLGIPLRDDRGPRPFPEDTTAAEQYEEFTLSLTGRFADGPDITGSDLVRIRPAYSAKNDENVGAPNTITLAENYPNPFNPVTTISFTLPHRMRVTMEIYNLLGQRIAVPVEGELEAGSHSMQWSGANIASGVYFYRLTAGEFMATKKMLLMK